MAGEGDAERLVVLLEARIRDFEKNMAKASGTAGKTYGQMRRDSRTATDRMEQDMVRSTARINQALAATSTKIGGMGKAMVAGFAGGLVAGGVAGIVSRLGQVASGVAAIGDEARRAGLDVRSFQELKYVAEQNRVGVDALTDGIKELNLRADEFIVTGGGSAAEAFQRLGYSAEELNQKLQDPSALFTEIIGKLQNLDRAAQIRIADELFGGTGGEQFVQFIGQGEEGIRRAIEEANSLGIVLDESVIAKAAEVDRKFNQVANTVGSALKQAIVDATGALVDFLNTLPKGAAEQFEDLTAQADATKDTLVRLANVAGDLFPDLEPQMREAVTQFLSGKVAAAETKQALLDIANGRPDLAPIIGDMMGLVSTLDNVIAKAREAAAAAAAAVSDPVGSGVSWESFQGTFFPKPSTKPGSGAKPGRDRAAEDAEREAKAVQNLIAGLEFERSLIGLSAVEQTKLNTLRQAGAAATDGQRAQIASLVEAINAEQAQVEYLTGVYNMLGQAGQTAVQGIIAAMADGKIEAEEFGDILSNVLSMAGQFFLNQAFTGIGSLFGGCRMPGFASGTPNTGGQRGQVRGVVHGQEAVIPLPDGGKVPVQIDASQLPGSAAATTVQIIDQRSSGRIERTEQSSGNGEKLLRFIVRDEIAQARRRGVPGF